MADAINLGGKAGTASQVMHYDDSANLRANPHVYHATGLPGGLPEKAVGTPTGNQYGGNLAKHSGTENLRADSRTLRASFAQAAGAGSETVGPRAGNYGNGVQSFGGLGARARGPRTPSPDKDED